MTGGQRDWPPAMPGAQGSDPRVAGDDDPRSTATPVRPPPHDVIPEAPRFDAAGIHSVLTRASDQSRFTAPEIEEERAARPVPFRALTFAFIAIALTGILIGFGYVTFLRPRQIDPNVIAKPTSTASNQVRAETPQQIVSQYFAALEEGDIERALAMGPRGGNGSERLLTRADFTATRERSNLNGVEILTRETDATRVHVRYRLGERSFDTMISLNLLDTGEYQLERTTVPIQFDVPGGEDLPLIVNGVSLDQGKPYEAVPGVYELTTGLPFIGYPDTSTITVISLDDEQKASPVPQLTAAGLDAFLGAAGHSLDACLAAPLKAPPNCPVGMDRDAAIDESSIRRVLANDPWAAARPSLTASHQTIVEVTVTIRYKLSYAWLAGGVQTPGLEEKVATVSANLLVARADQVTVTWER